MSCLFILTALSPLFGGTGRASDGFLFFIALLGFLGTILGILYLVDLVSALIRRLFEKNGQESLH